jgi:NitT/TauT family transport system substrate-binding protein
LTLTHSLSLAGRGLRVRVDAKQVRVTDIERFVSASPSRTRNDRDSKKKEEEKMRRGRAVLAAILCSLAFFFFTLSAFAQTKTVKVAGTSKDVLDNLPLFVGMKMGFFEEAGLKLDVSYFRGGGEIIRAITTRSVEIGATPAASPVFIAFSKGEPIRIISGSGAPMAGVVWIVAADSPIKSVKELRGKKVGFSTPGSLTHTVIQSILKREGMEKDVELVRVGAPGDSWAAAKNKIVDAGWHVSPSVYALIAKKEARIIIDASKYINEYQQTVVTAMEDVIKKDPEMLRNFLRARVKAVNFIYSNADKAIAIWADELKIPVDVARFAYNDLPKNYFETGAPKMENLKASMKEALDADALKAPIDLNKVLDLSLLPR